MVGAWWGFAMESGSDGGGGGGDTLRAPTACGLETFKYQKGFLEKLASLVAVGAWWGVGMECGYERTGVVAGTRFAFLPLAGWAFHQNCGVASSWADSLYALRCRGLGAWRGVDCGLGWSGAVYNVGYAAGSASRGHARRVGATGLLGVGIALAYWVFTGISPWPFVVLGEISGLGFGVAMLALASPRRRRP